MNVSEYIGCTAFPCVDVRHELYLPPEIDVDPENISVFLVSESAPADSVDGYYANGDPHFQQTTVMAFNDAGVPVSSIQELLQMGVYFTTAVKCRKTGYGIKAGTIKACSHILEDELALFPNVKVLC